MPPLDPTPIQAAHAAAPVVPSTRGRSPREAPAGTDAATPVAQSAVEAAEEAEYQHFLQFQNVGAESSKRALGGRRGTRLP